VKAFAISTQEFCPSSPSSIQSGGLSRTARKFFNHPPIVHKDQFAQPVGDTPPALFEQSASQAKWE
jgi:hypothetical protein